MIRKLLERFKKKQIAKMVNVGDVFSADAFDSLAGRFLEHIWYGLKRVGGESSHLPVYGPDSLRMKVRSDSMPYYILECEVLAYDVSDMDKKQWFPRKQPRRIMKDEFHDMILHKEIKKYEHHLDY